MLSLRNLSISIGPRPLLEGLSLEIAAGEMLTLTGASGTGKSTLLGWMVGALEPGLSARGELWLHGVRCDGLPTEQRHIGLLFQDDLLFPHLSVGHNLAFALPPQVRGTAARRALVEEALVDMGLAGFHDRDPATLSGGQRARVGLMRTLLSQPKALLLDEPYSSLDAQLRTQFRALVLQQVARLRIPALLVTHDAADIPPGGRVVQLGHSGLQSHV